MGVIAAALRSLLAAGVPADAIVAAVAEMESGGTVRTPDGKEFTKRKAYVYVIGGGWDQPVKIGFSKNPWARIESLQSASPMKLRVLCTFRTEAYSEFEIHRALDAYRVSGEWFALPEHVVAVFVRSFEAGSSYEQLLPATTKVAATVADVAPTVATTSPPLARGETNLTKVVDSTITERKKEVEVARSAPATKGTRLSPDWQPKEADWQFALDRLGPELATDRTAAFKDHWPGEPGQKAMKINWDGAYRNWIRSTRTQGARAGPPQRQTAKSQFLDVARDLIESQLNEPNRPHPGLPAIGGPGRGPEVGTGNKIIALVPNGGGRPVHHEGPPRSLSDFGEGLPFVRGERGM